MKIKVKMILLFISVFLILNLILGIYSVRTMHQKVIVAAQEKLISDLELGRELLDKMIPGEWEIIKDQLYKGQTQMYRNYDVVDYIGELTGDTVTIFKNNTRVTTNVPKKGDIDGRAVDTVVSDAVAKKVLDDGERFIGKAFVHDTWNQTAYEPILNNKGEIIGIWYVGVPNDFYDGMANDFRNEIILFNIIGILISILITWIVTGKITKPINKLKELMLIAETGDLSVRANIKGKDEVSDLGVSFNKMMTCINEKAEAIEKFSKGDLNIEVELKSENDVLGIALETMLNTMNQMKNEIDLVIESTEKGNINFRANSKNFEGTWFSLIEGINNIVEEYAKSIRITTNYITRIGNGDIPEKINEKYYGEFNQIKDSINKCIDSMNILLEDTNKLIKDAIDGKLDARANPEIHSGDYKEVVKGINSILDAVVAPIQEATTVLIEFSNGNLNSRVCGEYNGNHAEIKFALNNTIKNVSSYIEEIKNVLNKMAKKNFNQYIDREYMGDFVEIKKAINMILKAFNIIFADINVSAKEINTGASEVSDSAQLLSQGATEQAGAVEEMTASMNEVSEQTRNNADKAVEANKFADELKFNAEKGGEQMKIMLKSMDDINLSSKSISNVIKVIDDIAYQTNILALNASVEAARAGEYGKGFAVVAEEVRNLASQSANAAKETTELIRSSMNKIEDGLDVAEKTSISLNGIVENINNVANIIEDISVSSLNQAEIANQINEGINQISQVTQTNAEAANSSASISEEMAAQAELLKNIIDEFKLRK